MREIELSVRRYLLPQVVNAAIKGGAAIMEIYNNKEWSANSKDATMTETNNAAQSAVKEALGPTRIPILSEEGREMLYEERCNWEMFWLVDPLDGSVEFLNRSDEFTVNIALMSEGVAVLGVVYVPCLEKIYIAGRGLGSYVRCGVKPDAQSDMSYEQTMECLVSLPTVSQSRDVQRVAVSRSKVNADTYAYIDTLRESFPDLEIVEQGSSYKFCMLAEGSVDYYVRTSTTSEWDTAAGELILAESGGSTMAMDEEGTLKYNKRELHNPWFRCRSAISRIE